MGRGPVLNAGVQRFDPLRLNCKKKRKNNLNMKKKKKISNNEKKTKGGEFKRIKNFILKNQDL